MVDTTRQKIGRALAGFGAGVQGRGPEFLAGLRQQEQDLDENRKQALLKDAFTIQRMFQNGQFDAAHDLILNRVESINALGGDNSDTLELLNKFNSGDLEGVFNDVSTVVEFAQAERRLDFPGGAGKAFSQKTTGIQTDPATGQQFTGVFDPNTGTTIRQDIPGAFGETPTERSAREVGQVSQEATVRATATRTSQIKQEIGDRNRQAARSQAPLREALTLAQTASQGLKGSALLKLSRFLPDIDVTDEAALDANLKRLAIDELQKFKGPTTDFEFRVVQSIAGTVGDSRATNIARLKSLDRSNWFARREGQQFNKWVDQGNRPDNFIFNFQEELKTKRGTFSLQDLQDTAVAQNLTITEVLKKLNR